MFSVFLGMVPSILGFLVKSGAGLLSEKNSLFVGHAANLVMQGLSLFEGVQRADTEGRDITDEEITEATENVQQAADDFFDTLEGMPD